jgi:hypothetical protein
MTKHPDGFEEPGREELGRQVHTLVDDQGAVVYFFNHETKHYTVRVPAGLATDRLAQSLDRLGISHSFEPSRFASIDEVNRIQTDIATRDWSADAKQHNYGIGYDARVDRIVVATNAPTAALQTELDARHPGKVLVRASQVRRLPRREPPAPRP